jgi:hypothetical protein
MNIAFCIGRMNYLGHFGPIIDYFKSKNADIMLLCDNRHKSTSAGYKAYLYPDCENVREVFCKEDVKAFHTTEEFVKIIIEKQRQVVFFIAIDAIAKEVKKILSEKRINVIFAHIQPSGDIMVRNELLGADVVFIYCENWRGWWKEWLLHSGIISEKDKDCIFGQIDTKSVSCGFPMVDQLASYDRRAICEKYGIPEDRKIILFSPFPWRASFSVWSHIIYKPQSKIVKLARLFYHCAWGYIPRVFDAVDDLQVAKAIRQFADRNNAFFLVKSRIKNWMPPYLRRIADAVFFDESYYPTTIEELLFVADLCINFYSEVTKESVISNTPCICLGPPKNEDWPCYSKWFYLEDFSPKHGSFYSFNGVVYNESIDDFVKNFPHKSFDDYKLEAENRDEYVKKFLGYSDFKSSERIYNYLSHRLSCV